MTGLPTANIATPLTALAHSQPNAPAVIMPGGRRLTYRELDEESDGLARGLADVGVGRGVRTVLMVPPSPEFFALTFALFKAGAVVVLIDPGMGVRGLGRCLQQAQPEAFIGVPKAQLARVLLGWGRGTLKTHVTVGPRLGWGGHTLSEVRRRGARASTSAVTATGVNETAAILFTSGSTGPAKGAVYTHGIFAAQVEMLRRLYDIRPGEVDLPTFPLFGLFGPALGMTAVLPRMDFTRPAGVYPPDILNPVTQHGVTNFFGSPALLRRVGRWAVARGVRLPSLRRVISAGAPVPWQTLDTFRRLLADGVQVHTPYGATEVLPVCSIGSDEVLAETRHRTAAGAGVCVGRPVEGMRVKVIRISDEPVSGWTHHLQVQPGQIGEIAVCGPVVTASYYNHPEATTLAKIPDPQCAPWHRMGDVGYFDEAGRLWFCGRKSQRVVTTGGTLFTIPYEGVFNATPGVARTALVGVHRKGSVEPVLCVEPDPEAPPVTHEQLRRELLERAASLPHAARIRTFLFHPSFPVDIRHNTKIFREKLAVWAARRLQ
jgi:acyl-CoA synthetase (AMP-forming)/AMP-acid ligase II